MRIRIGEAVTQPVVQRNTRLPRRCVSRGTGEWIGSARIAARHRDRPVARQPVRPVIVAGAERLLDEQPAKSGAVDEQVALDNTAAGEGNRLYVAALAVELHIDDLALDPERAASFGVAAEECRIETGVEVERVTQSSERRPRALPRPAVAAHCGGNGAHRPGRDILHHATAALAQVQLVEMD